jgi:hypothetical protein
MKLCDYLNSKFGIRFADWTYDKLHSLELRISDLENSMKHTVNHTKDVLGKWKTSMDILMNTQLTFSSAVNPLQRAVSEELIKLSCEVDFLLQHISSNMHHVSREHIQCCKFRIDETIEVLFFCLLYVNLFCLLFVNHLMYLFFAGSYYY